MDGQDDEATAQRHEDLLAHLERHLGPSSGVFHELISPGLHLDLVFFPATDDRPFQVVVTEGVSDMPMRVSERMKAFERQEFFICLPRDWPVPDGMNSDERSWWPMRLLKVLGRLPHDMRSFVAPATTVPNGDPAKPYAEGTELCAALVWSPVGMPHGFAEVATRTGTLRLSHVIPITASECAFKLQLGHEELYKALEQFAPGFAVVDPRRRCAVTALKQRMAAADGIGNSSYATRPGGITLCEERLREWVPELYTGERPSGILARVGLGKEQSRTWIDRIAQHVEHGDAQPALVVRVEPLVIAAHTDELDTVVLLASDADHTRRLIDRHGLQIGSRLLAVNMYGDSKGQTDIIEGPKARGVYSAFTPVIADFLTADRDQLALRKSRISDAEYADVQRKADAYIAAKGLTARLNHPILSALPGTRLDAPGHAHNGTGPIRQRSAARRQRDAPARREADESGSGGVPRWLIWVGIVIILAIVRLMLRSH
jgi:hypothetical protein